jgi:hypothetical protein
MSASPKQSGCAILISAFLLFPILVQAKSSGNTGERILRVDTVIVRQDLPPFVITLSATGEQYDSARISISQEKTGKPLQSIAVEYSWVSGDLEYMDINFDGYRDIRVMGHGNNAITTTSSFLLFNPQTNAFEESEEYSGFDEIDIDTVNHEISSWSSSVGNRKSNVSSTYKVIGNHLVLVGEEHYNGEDEQEEKKLLNGVMTIVSRSTSRSATDSIAVINQRDDETADLVIVTTEKWVFDSLRVVSEIRKRKYFGANSDSLWKKGIEWEDEWGKFRFERETTYEYSGESNGPLYVDQTVKEVVNGAWVAKPRTRWRVR